MRTTKLPPPTRFAGKAAGKREQSGTGTGYAERLRVGEQDPGMQKQARRVFLGNGLMKYLPYIIEAEEENQ